MESIEPRKQWKRRRNRKEYSNMSVKEMNLMTIGNSVGRRGISDSVHVAVVLDVLLLISA
jgi:hypothetical protein